jgi:rhodanese-related sulfurtransferase
MSITVQELRNLLKEDRAADTLVLDVRTAAEFQQERIIGVTNIPLDELEKHVDKLRDYKHIYVHCASGNRSGQACQRLHHIGLDNIVNVDGGMQAWKSAGFPVFSKPGIAMPIGQQVQLAAGSLVVIGVLLALLVDPNFILLSGFVGAGLMFAGVSGTCTLGLLLARMPWNRA